MNRLAGKRVLITGASAGIGEACARQFAERGAHVLLSARRLDRVLELAKELAEAHGVEAHAHSLDVTDSSAVTAYGEQLEANGHIPDIVVANAGKALGLEPIQEGKLEDWEEMIDTNIKGVLYICRAMLPHMIERNSGHVILIGSIAGRWVYPRGGVYNATKFAVRALSEAMNIDMLGTNIRVSSVDPGLTETEFSEVRFHGDAGRAKTVYENTQPLTGDDVADAIVYVSNTPEHVDILNLVMMPTAQRYVGMIAREGA
jgi:NADP-dependent 3-hydroxy acid dehydrogenase YdfG